MRGYGPNREGKLEEPMRISALFAFLGKVFTLTGAESVAAQGFSSPSSLVLVGLAGLAMLTLRSERWRTGP